MSRCNVSALHVGLQGPREKSVMRATLGFSGSGDTFKDKDSNGYCPSGSVTVHLEFSLFFPRDWLKGDEA